MLVDTNDQNKKDRDRDCVYAELATYNWVLALASEIINTHGGDLSQWKESLHDHYKEVAAKPPVQNQQRKIFQKIFHAINCGLSIRNKYLSGYFNYFDIVGTISDYYYALYNAFNSISMSWDIPENTSHAKNINIFESLRDKYPYPFNMYAKIDPSQLQEKVLINPDHFLYCLPGKLSTSETSTSNINTPHRRFPLPEEVATDILLGYLRGNVDFLIDGIKTAFINDHKLKMGIRKLDDKKLINPQLKKIRVNFLRCLYRYRTKAHYRDFAYLTYRFTNREHKVNNSMDVEFYNSLAIITEFAVSCSVIHSCYKLGKSTTTNYLKDMTSNFKDDISNFNDYWNKLL